MYQIREQLKNPLVVGIVGFIIGIIIGWFVIGWGVWPVEWTNAQPEHMSPSAQAEYLRMAIEAYGQNGDIEKAQTRFNALGENTEDILAAVNSNPQGLSPDLIMNFSSYVSSGIPITPPTTEADAPPFSGDTGEEESGTNWLTILIPILCVLVLVLAAVLFYIFVVRGRMANSEQAPLQTSYDEPQGYASGDEYIETDGQPPIAQFMASFKLGDNLFDDSFSIESPSGEFLGECGVDISEAIGIGEPKKVTAFEIWLFDKNDIQTVTKVLMSEHAYYDEAVRQRLETKGEPVLAQPGEEIILETQTLSLCTRIVDMSYGDGAAPDQSIFEHMVVELLAYYK